MIKQNTMWPRARIVLYFINQSKINAQNLSSKNFACNILPVSSCAITNRSLPTTRIFVFMSIQNVLFHSSGVSSDVIHLGCYHFNNASIASIKQLTYMTTLITVQVISVTYILELNSILMYYIGMQWNGLCQI